MDEESLGIIVRYLREADGLLVTAGAGMGVDSGLPDFRGTEGFWRAYPALGQGGIRFESIANPASFRRDPRLTWGFYGHRLSLYRAVEPHRGFHLLQSIGATLEHGLFAFTSNVDGHFQKSGVPGDCIEEAHGSIHHLQCMEAACSSRVWSAEDFRPEIDAGSGRLLNELPTCPRCGELARPNILMFGDWEFRPDRQARQAWRLQGWLERVRRPVVIEVGAGTSVPTVRRFGEHFERLIRINPREPGVQGRLAVGVPLPALEAFDLIAAGLGLVE